MSWRIYDYFYFTRDVCRALLAFTALMLLDAALTLSSLVYVRPAWLDWARSRRARLEGYARTAADVNRARARFAF